MLLAPLVHPTVPPVAALKVKLFLQISSYVVTKRFAYHQASRAAAAVAGLLRIKWKRRFIYVNTYTLAAALDVADEEDEEAEAAAGSLGTSRVSAKEVAQFKIPVL